jgi:hypothetical protein
MASPVVEISKYDETYFISFPVIEFLAMHKLPSK